jgi:hypothetical protein
LEVVTKRYMRRLNAKKERAAILVSEDRLIDQQIAETIGISRQQLVRWKAHPVFAARVAELTRIWTERALRYGLARRERRLAVLEDQHNRLLAVIHARAADPSMADVPGGNTGLLLRTYKGLGNGDAARIVEEFSVDCATIRELRGIQEQFAKELGQVQPTEVVVTQKKLYHTTEELEAELAALLAKRDSNRPEDAPC